MLPPNQAPVRQYLPRKKTSATSVQTMDEARLEDLRQWLAARMGTRTGGMRISEVTVAAFDDFAKIMELARSGFLNSGNRLARIEYRLTDRAAEVALDAGEQRLTLREMLVTKTGRQRP